MTTRIVVACVCIVLGLGAIVAVASTAGPPDGYRVFADRDVRVYLPSDFEQTQPIEPAPDIIVSVAGPDHDSVQVAAVPTRGRTMAAYERFTLENVRNAAPGATDLRREDVDVPGADEARRISFFRDSGKDVAITMIIARDNKRFVTLSITDVVGNDALDEHTVEDSFAITS